MKRIDSSTGLIIALLGMAAMGLGAELQWQATATRPEQVSDGATATITIKVDNQLDRERTFEYRCRVVDFFQRPQLEKEGRLTVEAKAVGAQEISWPTGDSRLYRAQIEVSPAGSEEQQTVWRYVVADRLSGRRPRIRVDIRGPWEHLPTSDGQAGYPPAGEWQPGGGKFGRLGTLTWPHHFSEDTEAVWFRRGFRVPDWMRNERYQLTFTKVGFACEVYLNGTHVGGHIGDVVPFSVDVTEAVRVGQDNELALKIFDIRGWLRDPEQDVGVYFNTLWPVGLERYTLEIRGGVSHHTARCPG